KYVAKVEEEHAALYQNALANLDGLEDTTYFVCSYCGHVQTKEAPEKCPVCGAPKSQFKEID
ncbi:MAG: rubredoxin-like domain-containing protein, partial [Actinomycetota bacterium]